jgi:DNA-binding MarR family transcriptional regulator
MAASVPAETRNLARFRYAVRKMFSTTDDEARRVGLTPQQHQLLLSVVGFTGKGWASIGELAECLQVRHHSAVGLVDRAVEAGWVRREANPENRRQVHVMLTADGLRKLRQLGDLHRKELNGLRRSFDIFQLERDAGAKDMSARRRRR